jgi:23S rRNA pseudouridine1911/1915/1917 synthase
MSHDPNSLEVLYVDNHMLAVNKPAGLLTQSTQLGRISLEEVAREWVRKTYKKPGNVFLEAIHRIDKPVSGVVVFARTSKGLSRLTKAIRERQCKKLYFAVAEDSLAHFNEQEIFEDYLVHDEYRARITTQSEPGSKLARMHCHILERKHGLLFLEIVLETGRYHQIRIQLASRRCPIVGDQKYGSQKPHHPGMIALHHRQLSILHPVKDEQILITAPLPRNWPCQ